MSMPLVDEHARRGQTQHFGLDNSSLKVAKTFGGLDSVSTYLDKLCLLNVTAECESDATTVGEIVGNLESMVAHSESYQLGLKLNTNSHLARNKPRRFTLFSNLPKELQLKVFKTAQLEEDARIVEITFDVGNQQLVSLSSPPALLSVCITSREEVLKVLKRLPTPHGAPPIYVDLDRDYVFIREDYGTVLAESNRLLSTIFGLHASSWNNRLEIAPLAGLSSVKNLALDFNIIPHAWAFLDPLLNLRSVREFCIVLAKRNTNPLSSPGHPVKSAKDLIEIGFDSTKIKEAVDALYGYCEQEPIGIQDLVKYHIAAELNKIQQADPTWGFPGYSFVSYGIF